MSTRMMEVYYRNYNGLGSEVKVECPVLRRPSNLKLIDRQVIGANTYYLHRAVIEMEYDDIKGVVIDGHETRLIAGGYVWIHNVFLNIISDQYWRDISGSIIVMCVKEEV